MADQANVIRRVTRSVEFLTANMPPTIADVRRLLELAEREGFPETATLISQHDRVVASQFGSDADRDG